MAIIDRLNEVFGVGEWDFKTEHISHEGYVQKTKNGDRDMFRSAVKGTLIVPNSKGTAIIEQFGGSSNDDLGDALKGGATDALTKCASYLGIGASIYKNMGNVAPPKEVTTDEALTAINGCTSIEQLQKVWVGLPQTMRDDNEVEAKKDELKTKLS